MILIIRKIFDKLGIDGAIGFTLLTRMIQAAGGLIAIIFISIFLSLKEQGFYYTFASILAIQIFLELGLSGIITQYAAHEFAYLEWKDGFTLSGDNYYKSRLSSLLRFCVKWFGLISIFLFFILLIAGFYFFKNYNKDLNIEWQRPWVFLCLTTSLNLFIDPLLAFFDGLNQVKEIAKLRLYQKSANIILLFVFFSLGFKLYAAGLASLCAIGVNYFQIIFSHKIKVLKIIWASNGDFSINYFKEIFPFQWRIAVSWISGYFIFQLFNPVLFATEGAVVAGQMGMTLAALNGVLSLSLSWINTKIPLFSRLIAKKEFLNLDLIFNNTVTQSSIVTAILLLLLIIVISSLKFLKVPIGLRFLNTLPLILLCLSTLVSQYVYALATYLRCHKQEPFLIQSLVMGLLTALSTFVLGNKYGVMGITLGYCILTVSITLTWSIIIFNRKKILWHKV